MTRSSYGLSQPFTSINPAQNPLPPAVPIALVLQYSDEKQIKDALNEAASPATPLFGLTISDKSKYLIYEAFFKVPTVTILPQISFETKLRMQSGMIADLVDPVINSADVTMKNITEVNAVLGQFITNLKQIYDDLSTLKSNDAMMWKERFQRALYAANDKQIKLTTKLERQNIFFKKLDDLQLMPATQLKEKTNSLLNMSVFLNKEPKDKYKEIVSSLRDDFINAIARLVTAAQGGQEGQKNIVIKFLDKLGAYGSVLTAQEQDKIKSFKQLLTSAVQPPATPSTVLQPLQVGVGAQVSGSAPIATPGPTQAPVIGQSTTQPTPAAGSQPQNNLLQDALNKLNGVGQDFDKLIDACDFCLDTFSKDLSAVEKQLLASKVQEKINFAYDKRIALKNDLLIKLDKLLDKAKSLQPFKTFVTAQKVSTVKAAIALNNAYISEKVFTQFASELKKVIMFLSKDVSDYEKNRFIDAVDSLFANRKNDEIKKLGFEPIFIFKDLLEALNLPEFKSKSVFNNTVQSKFVSYSKVIDALMILLRPTLAKDLQSKLNFYRPIIDALSIPDTDYEKWLFFETIVQIYSNRGNFGYADLEMLKNFFKDIINKSGVLSSAARVKLETDWLVELTNAINITPKPENGKSQSKLYLEVLIELSMNLADFAKNIVDIYPKIFSLFTSDTPVRVINIFLTKLNELVQARSQIDRQKLLSFLSIKKLTIDRTGVNEIASLLPEKQKETLRSWIKILQDELNPSQI